MKTYNTTKFTPWKNTKEILVFHHTGWWTFEWNCNYLSSNPAQASCHYVVWQDWEVWKIWSDDNILWHRWASSWNWKAKDNSVNAFSIWIEIVWPWFTDKQRLAVKDLAISLIKKYGIKEVNVVRHKDIAPWRKNDVDDSFWVNSFKTWNDYKKTLFIKEQPMTSKYETLYNDTIKRTWFTPLFNSHEWLWAITEQDTKFLIEIACARMFEDFINNKKAS